MAQHDYVIANDTAAQVRADINNALAAIVSQNSGATEPSTTYAYQFWYDTANNILKMRNSADDAWISTFEFDQTGDLVDDLTITDMTISNSLTNTLIRTKPGYIENVGIFLSGGVITLKGYDGTSWSASNPGYICGQSSANPGQLVLHTLTSDVTLTDSDVDGNLFGFPTGVALDFDVEFSIKLVADDSDANPLFFITRDHQSTVAPAEANIGASDDLVADAIGDYFCFTTLTEGSYDGNAATQVGKFRGTMNASDEWAFTALDEEKDGVGIKYPKKLEWELISIAEASASASLDFDLPEDYDEFMFRFEAIQPATDGASLRANFYEGGSGGTIVNDYGRCGLRVNSAGVASGYDTFESAINVAQDIGNVLSEAVTGYALVYGCNLVSVRGKMQIRTYHNDPDFKQTVSERYDYIGGEHDSYDFITFFMDSGNITSGRIGLYGRRYYIA